MLTDKVGCRIFFLPVTLTCVVPIGLIGEAKEFLQFLALPFSRPVHVWSGSATLAYDARAYQVVWHRCARTQGRCVDRGPLRRYQEKKR